MNYKIENCKDGDAEYIIDKYAVGRQQISWQRFGCKTASGD